MVHIPDRKLIWLSLIVYRWVALLHIFVLLLSKASRAVPLERGWFLFSLAFIYASFLTFFQRLICENRPFWSAFLGVDLLVCLLLMSSGGGWRNAWYLYSFSPVLIAALFYHMRGGVIAAAISSLFYWLSIFINGRAQMKLVLTNHLDDLISNIFSFFLIAVFFAYPCSLFDRLKQIQMELAETRKDLKASERQLSILYKISPLTKREMEVLKLLAQSKNNKEIAKELYISEETVKSHIKSIFRKLGFKSRTEAASYFWRLKL